MNRYALLALGLALTLPCAGSRANDQTGTAGTDNQPGTTATNGQPATVPANPQPGLNQPSPQAPLGQDNQQLNNGPLNLQPNNSQLNQPPNNGQLNPQPNNGQLNQQPNNGLANPQPNAGQPNPQPGNVPATQQPNADLSGTTANGTPGSMAAAAAGSPLQQFVGHQIDEVAALQPQFDAFRAANRPEAVRVLYFMVRDHVLVADAARNLLARQGQVSRPVTMPTTAVVADTPEQMIKQDIDAHQQTLSDTQQMLANASTPEEQSIYQQAINKTQKHLTWLRAIDQGQQVALGYFGPTVPLNRIAGYREQVGQTNMNSSQRRRPRTISSGRRSRHHRHYYHHHYGSGYRR